MSKSARVEWLESRLGEESAIAAVGFDEAIIGMVDIDGVNRVCYSQSEIIEILERDGMSNSEAMEYFEFNIEGAVIEGGPLFIDDLYLM